MPRLDPALIDVDPVKDPIENNSNINSSMYQLAYNNTFTEEELGLLSTVKRAARVHKRLNLLDQEKAFEKFSKLETTEQAVLKYFYGDGNAYMQQPENWLGKARLMVGEAISSPFKSMLDIAGKYGAVLNATSMIAENKIVNGDDLINIPGLYRLFADSESFYDNGVADRLEQKHGKVKSYIAKQTLRGKTIPEIFKEYGKLTPEFVEAMTSFVNEESLWNEGILEDFRQAKLGGGRFVGRALFGNRGLQGKSLLGKKFNRYDEDKLFTLTSGTAGLAQMILTDPLSYFTGGGSAGMRFLGKSSFKLPVLGEVRVSNRAFINDLATKNDIKGLFAEKDVRRFWDAYGKEIHLLTIARENGETKKAQEIFTRIKTNFFRHNTDEEIEWAIKNKFYRAADVEKYAEDANNFAKAISGKVAQTSFHKFGVATAADIRKEGMGLRELWHKYATKGTLSSFKNVQVGAKEFTDELKQLGSEKRFRAETPVLNKSIEDVTKFKAAFRRVIALHPSDEVLEMGENAANTLSTVRSMFRLIAPRDLADTAAEEWLTASVGERFQMYEGFYRALAIKMGIDKLPNGMKLVDDLINEKFGQIGMRASGTSTDPADWTKVGDPLKDLPNFIDDIEGSLYDFQTTNRIGNVNWIALGELQAEAARYLKGKDITLSQLGRYVGGVANSRLVSTATAVWSLGVLAIKLGIRSVFDEKTMFTLSAPKRVLFDVFSRKAKSGAKVLTRFTADKSTTGVIGSFARKILVKPFGIKGMDPINELGNAKRQDILSSVIMHVADEELPEEAIMPIFNKLLAQESVSYAHLLDADESRWMVEALTSNPNFLKSVEASTARSIGLGAIAPESKLHFIPDTMLTQTLDAADVAKLPGYRLLNPNELAEEQFKLVMYDKFFVTFYHNIIKNGTKQGMNLGEMFIYHNGLRTAEDAKNFIKAFMDSGLVRNGKLTDAGKSFIMNRKGAELKLLNGQNNVKIIEDYARAIARDMYEIFHGNTDAGSFNEELFNFFRNNPEPSLAAGTLKDHLNALDFEKYSAMVIGKNIRRTPISTNIVFGGVAKDFNWYSNKIYEFYDRTVTAMHRAPATVAYYFYYRRLYQNSETGSWARTFEKLKSEGDLYRKLEKKYGKVDADAKIAEIADRQVGNQFAELALNNAINSVLKYSDNPHIRTNFVVAARNISRFARATEDFWRRVYRLKDVSPRALYRLRLLHNGLNNAGSTYEDENGDTYFIIPNDNIIFAAINPVFEQITGQGFLSPIPGSEYAVKFSALNPSFQDQAGIPYAAGPLAVLNVLGLQAMANAFGGKEGPVVADSLDNLIFGELGDNLSLQSLIPGVLTRTWSMVDKDEESEINHSAILSAIASAQAFGDALPANATPQEREKWLSDRRTAAHNFIFMRSVMGTILPFGVTSKEIADMPNYIQEMGVTSIRSEYYEILLSLIEQYGDDIEDPFEVATAIFVGKNPGKLVYTISRNNKEVKPIIAQTEETRKWILSNKDFIKTYEDTGAAYFFAPQSGKIDKAGYEWLRKTGVIEDIPIRKFLKKAQVAVDKQNYFDITDWENEQLSKVTDYEERRSIIKKASLMRDAMKSANPLLEEELNPEGGFNVIKENRIFDDLKIIVQDKNSPISPAERKRVKNAIKIFEGTKQYFEDLKFSSSSAAPEMKIGARDRTIKELKKMAQGDPLLQQINRLVFIPILKFEARDVTSASAVG